MPCLTKHADNSPINFFTISRRYHLKWLSSYANHISGYVLTFKETMSSEALQPGFVLDLVGKPVYRVCREAAHL